MQQKLCDNQGIYKIYIDASIVAYLMTKLHSRLVTALQQVTRGRAYLVYMGSIYDITTSTTDSW